MLKNTNFHISLFINLLFFKCQLKHYRLFNFGHAAKYFQKSHKNHERNGGIALKTLTTPYIEVIGHVRLSIRVNCSHRVEFESSWIELQSRCNRVVLVLIDISSSLDWDETLETGVGWSGIIGNITVLGYVFQRPLKRFEYSQH